MADSDAAASPGRSTLQALLLKVGKLGLRYLRQHAEDAQKEGARDLRRLAIGLACCVVGAVFALHALILLHAAAVVLLPALIQVEPGYVLLGIVGIDALISLFAVLIGASMIRRPFLTRTRATLREVQTFLVEI